MTAAGRVTVAVALLLTVGVGALHLVFHRHAGALWRDEANSVNLAAMPSLAAVVANSHLDTFGIPWVTLLHGWTSWGLGETDTALRRFGLVIGLATLPVLWWSARRLGLDAPLVTLLLYGMSPAAIVYGDSLRGYGLGALALAWCLGAVWTFVARPTWPAFALAQVSAVLAVQTYFPNGVLLAAICAGAAAVCVRRRTWRLLAGVAGLGGVAAASLVANIAWIANALRIGGLEQQNPTLRHLLGVFREAPAAGVQPLAALWVAAPCLAILGCGLALRTGQARDRERALFVATTTAVGLGGYLLYLHDVARLPTQYWYYLSLLVLLALACDVGIDLLAGRRRWGAWARLAVVALLAMPIGWGTAKTVAVRMTNLDLVARGLATAARSDDLIVVVPWVSGITFQRYYGGSAPWITLPDFADHRFHRHLELKEKMRLGDAAIAPELARIERTLRDGGRVWLVGQPRVPPSGDAPPRLPSAPTAPTGWRAGPYLDGWEAQLGVLLRTRGRTVQRVELPDAGPTNAWENPPAFLIEGWQ